MVCPASLRLPPGRTLQTLSIFASDDFDPMLSLNDSGSGQTLMATTGTVIDLGDQSGNPSAVSLDFGAR